MKCVRKIVAGTGAAINVELGFTPDFVKIIGTTDPSKILMYDVLDTVNAYGTVPATGLGAADAAHGIIPYAGDTTHSKGITIGASCTPNENAHSMLVIAQLFDPVI